MGWYFSCSALVSIASHDLADVSPESDKEKFTLRQIGTKEIKEPCWRYSRPSRLSFFLSLHRLFVSISAMNPRVLKRFTVLMFIAVLFTGGATLFYDSFFDRPPGDYETKRGDILLSSGDYDDAMKYFNKALEFSPNHRGALMGRALVFIQTERYAEAENELDSLIDWLAETLPPDDTTGRGALAAAYANRAIILDRQGSHSAALDDYIKALQVDEDSVAGPGLVYKILYDPRPSTVRTRARYIYEQLQLPEEERLLMQPTIDAESRMHKP